MDSDDQFISNMQLAHFPSEPELWDTPKEFVLTLDGNVVARGPITGIRVEGGTQKCSDPECAGHLMPSEFLYVTALVAPPMERRIEI